VRFFSKSKNMLDTVPEKVRVFLLKDKKERSVDDQIVPIDQGESRSIQANDRAALDLLSEVERFMKDREVLRMSNVEQRAQLDHLEQRVALLVAEKDKYIYQFLDKEEEIKGIEDALTKKHQLYDQLIEEYKKLQAITSSEIGELKSEIEVEQHKYSQLVQEFKDYRNQIIIDQDALQEKVRRLEAKNEDLKEQVGIKAEENEALMAKINQFSEQFTFAAINKKNSKGKAASKPKPEIVVEEKEAVNAD